MVHAFIHQYSCQKPCCEPIINKPALGGEGPDGHGPAWMDCMVHLSFILQQTVSWEVDVVVEGARMTMYYDRYQPNKKQLQHWGLDPNVWGHIQNWDADRQRILEKHGIDDVVSVVSGTDGYQKGLPASPALVLLPLSHPLKHSPP